MYNIVSKLIIYGDMPKDSILMELSNIIKEYKQADEQQGLSENKKSEIITHLYKQVKRILEVATDYGFNDNLWHNYLTYLLITDENPFSITCEKIGASNGSVNHFAKNDFKQFQVLFDYDFSEMENKLGIDCFCQLENYQAIGKPELMYNKNVSEKVRSLSKRLEAAKDEKEFFAYVTEFYKDFGVGMLGLHKAFRILHKNAGPQIEPITNIAHVHLDDLVGYEIAKAKLIENTEAFVKGKKANNCLLYGDAGTGKSATVKAVANAFHSEGLRLIELKKNQLHHIPTLMDSLSRNPLKFILFIDDLSFSRDDDNFSALKAVLEGSVSAKTRNLAIYATSNRRHLVKECFSDRQGDEIHASDTLQELVSLSDRFGLTVTFTRPAKQEYLRIAAALALQQGLKLPAVELSARADQFALHRGGYSPRTAKQFVESLLSQS